MNLWVSGSVIISRKENRLSWVLIVFFVMNIKYKMKLEEKKHKRNQILTLHFWNMLKLVYKINSEKNKLKSEYQILFIIVYHL